MDLFEYWQMILFLLQLNRAVNLNRDATADAEYH